MKNKYTIIITSLGSGIFIFVLMYLFENLAVGIIGGLIATISSFLFMLNAFNKGYTAIENLKVKLSDQIIEYIDIASLMVANKELIGALAITDMQIIFSTNIEITLQFSYNEIKHVSNSKGFLLIIDTNGQTYRFKVFKCRMIVKLIHNKMLIWEK